MVNLRIKYNGSKVTLKGFGFQKYQMLQLATVGLASVKERVSRAVGVNDSAMPPLKSKPHPNRASNRPADYPSFKRLIGKQPIRDLTLTGNMLANLTVRSASNTEARIALTQRLSRTKALANEKRAEWLGWSPHDTQIIVAAAEKIFKQQVVTAMESQLFKKAVRGLAA